MHNLLCLITLWLLFLIFFFAEQTRLLFSFALVMPALLLLSFLALLFLGRSLFTFVSELMDVFMLAGSVQQANEPKDLAQGQTPL